MTTNLFVIANVKQSRTGGSFRILLLFFPNILVCWRLNSAIFKSFHNRIDFGTILVALGISGVGGLNPPKIAPTPRYATATVHTENKYGVKKM